MKYTIHNLRELDPKLLPMLAEIHMGDHGLLSELGYPFVDGASRSFMPAKAWSLFTRKMTRQAN